MSFAPSATSPPLPPYLGARAHLSLSWLSQTFLSIILLLASTALLISTVPGLVSDAKSTLLSSCDGVERAADVMVSLPHYMATGINELNVKSIQAVTTGLADSLDLLLLAVQEIVVFMIEMYLGLYLCLLDLAVHGALTLVIDGVQEAEGFITSAFSDVRTEVQSAVESINSDINSTIAVINELPLVDISAPQMTVPTLSSLANVTFSPSFLNDLEALNSTIPSYDGLKADLEALISTPVDALRTTISSTLGNATLSVELLPVPATSSVGFCANLDTSFLDDVGRALSDSLKVALGLLLLALFVLGGVSLLWEKFRYKRYVEGISRAKLAWQSDLARGADALSVPSLLAFLGAAQSPTVSHYLAKLSNKLRLSPSQRANLHWFGAYVLHPCALMFLALGVVGLIVVEIQIAALEGPVQAEAHRQAQTGTANLASSVVGLINQNMNQTSVQYANETNAVFQTFSDGINNDLFGWINTTTTALNTTLVTFYDELTEAITDLFNGTILEDPALDLVYCLLGSKVNSLEEALTYLNQHLHLTVPTVSDDVLMLSSNQTHQLTASLADGNSTLSSTSVVDRMVASYARTLASQRLGFILCIAIWAIVLFMGLVGLWWRIREERRASTHINGLKSLRLSGGAKGGFELKLLDEKSVREMQPASPTDNPARNTLAAYLSRLSAVFGETKLNRRQTATTFSRSEAQASPSPRATSFAALRSRVSRPAPAFRSVRNALTSVLPSATSPKESSKPLAKQTWDPPTSPQSRVGSEGAVKARTADWLTSNSPPLGSITRKRVPSPGRAGWENLPSPSSPRHAVPPSPPYQRHISASNSFADDERVVDMSSSSTRLLPAYTIPAGSHPFSPVSDPFQDEARERPSASMGGARAVDPFATPFDGAGER